MINLYFLLNDNKMFFLNRDNIQRPVTIYEIYKKIFIFHNRVSTCADVVYSDQENILNAW